MPLSFPAHKRATSHRWPELPPRVQVQSSRKQRPAARQPEAQKIVAAGKIGLLHLDSMDTVIPGSAEHGLKKFKAAPPHLHKRSIVMFDDTAYCAKGYRGKAAQAVPHMLAHGWKILFSGYQTALVRRYDNE